MSDRLERVRERAVEYVAEHGDALERPLAEALGGGQGDRLVAWLAAEQRSDGGFPPDGSPVALRRCFGALADVGALESLPVERACRYLEETQSEAGFWQAGGEAEDIRETGLLTGLLARTHFARADTLDAAADWLAERFSPERVQGFAWEAIAAYGACFTNLPHDAADGILQWCGRELQRGYLARRFDAIRTGRVLAWCDSPSVPGASVAAPKLVAEILAAQAEDGSWPAPEGVPPATHAVDALAVLRRFA